MTETFTVSLAREGSWVIAQCLEVDVASQGRDEEEALANLRDALELHFEAPTATLIPDMRKLEVKVGAT